MGPKIIFVVLLSQIENVIQLNTPFLKQQKRSERQINFFPEKLERTEFALFGSPAHSPNSTYPTELLFLEESAGGGVLTIGCEEKTLKETSPV